MEPARETDDFTRRITVADSNNIVAVLDMAAVNSEYQIFESDYVVKFQVVLEELKITVGLFSLAEAPWPDTNALMSESATMAEISKIRSQGQKISLQLYTAKGNGPWMYQSKVVLMNQGGEETHVPILVPFLSTNETLLVGGDFKLGVRVEPIWNQPLKANDYLVIKGTWRQIVSFSKKKDDDVEALSARIAALELALQDRLTNLPGGVILGRNGSTGTVQQIPQSQFATPAQITTAINALTGNSSTALDTLAELGAALANDASFAATVTNALTFKAPIQSPNFTGLPLAPTAIFSTNSFQIATTAFVQAVTATLKEIKTLALTNPLNIAANTWFTVGQFIGIGLGSEEALYAITIYIQYGDGTNTYGHWQYSGGGLISCIQWKSGGVQLATSFKMEAHNGNDFNCSVRFDISSVNRSIQVSFDIPIVTQSPSLLRVKLRRLINS